MRETTGTFLAEGPRVIAEGLADPRDLVRELFVTDEARRRYPELIETATCAVHLVSGPVMSALAQTVTPTGVVAVMSMCDLPAAEAVGGRLAVLLAAVRDPGNAGTVLRTADAAGADVAVFSDAAVDPYNPKCVRASAGSLFHLPFARGVPVADAIAAARAAGLTVLAADAAGPVELFALIEDGSLARPTAWLFGNESWGLPADVAAAADAVVRVPIRGRAESLNLAAAAAVCLYASAGAHGA
jgi:TrmH family RNA methyltransferase